LLTHAAVCGNYVVSVNATNEFKNRLDNFWHIQNIMYNFVAQIHVTGNHSMSF